VDYEGAMNRAVSLARVRSRMKDSSTQTSPVDKVESLKHF